jgi:ribosomal protein S18 acetylase RimI-like enzyme
MLPIEHVHIELKYDKGAIILDRIIVEKKYRNKGLGKKAMEELCRFADETNSILLVSPSNFMRSSIRRLNKFYRSFGFVKRRGFYYLSRSSMMRLPIKN